VGDLVYNPLFAYGYGITSLNDSPAGSSPEVYSASVITDLYMEISFNKKMAAPPNAPAGFSVIANGSTPLSIASVSLKNSDSTTFIITLSDTLRKTDTYAISYTPGNIQSRDQGRLAAFDSASVHNLLADYQYCHIVPGKIEAEQYYIMQGISTISCSDEGGGNALSNIHNGDWAEYYVNVPQSGIYPLEYRISSVTDTGRIELMSSKDTIVSILDLPATGSLDTWQSVPTVVHLSEGPQVMRIYALRGGFRLNWMMLSLITGVRDNGSGIGREFQLSQNYPNPFNPSTVISYSLPEEAKVKIEIYNLLGQKVAALVDAVEVAGNHSVTWDAHNFSSGIYYYRIKAEGKKIFEKTQKLVLIR
jgi:hypothetical protein